MGSSAPSPRPLVLLKNRETPRRREAGGRGELSEATRGLQEGKTSGTGGKSGPPAVSPKLLGVTPSARGPPSHPQASCRPASTALPRPRAAQRLRESGAAPTPRKCPLAQRAPQRLRGAGAAGSPQPGGTRPLSSASPSTRSPAATLPLSPLTARRHFPRSSALNRKLVAPQPAAAAAAAAAATDSAAAAAAVAVKGLRRPPP